MLKSPVGSAAASNCLITRNTSSHIFVVNLTPFVLGERLSSSLGAQQQQLSIKQCLNYCALDN